MHNKPPQKTPTRTPKYIRAWFNGTLSRRNSMAAEVQVKGFRFDEKK